MNKTIVLNILKLSRPRFWFYTAGSYLLGFTIAATSLQNFGATFWYGLFFFLLPANIFLYGVNDIFDEDTDNVNTKKETYETRVTKNTQLHYVIAVSISLLFAIPFFFFLSTDAMWIFILFLFLSLFYSAPPLRFKAQPIWDFSSNILYVLPGFIGFLVKGSTDAISPMVILALFLGTSALHLFSAIPDIEADTHANIQTSATWLGTKNSLILCFLFWGFESILLTIINPLFCLALIRAALPLFILLKKKSLTTVYWWLPWINAYVGFLCFYYFLYKIVGDKPEMLLPPLTVIVVTGLLLVHKNRHAQ